MKSMIKLPYLLVFSLLFGIVMTGCGDKGKKEECKGKPAADSTKNEAAAPKTYTSKDGKTHPYTVRSLMHSFDIPASVAGIVIDETGAQFSPKSNITETLTPQYTLTYNAGAGSTTYKSTLTNALLMATTNFGGNNLTFYSALPPDQATGGNTFPLDIVFSRYGKGPLLDLDFTVGLPNCDLADDTVGMTVVLNGKSNAAGKPVSVNFTNMNNGHYQAPILANYSYSFSCNNGGSQMQDQNGANIGGSFSTSGIQISNYTIFGYSFQLQ